MKSKNWRSGRSQAGDTIVEVLICIAVVAMVMAGAFAVVSRSTQTVQDTDEHAKAQLYLQSQVEQLRSYLGVVGNTPPTAGAAFCMTGAGAPVLVSGTNCTIKIGGADFAQSATRDATDTYTFTITWPALGGQSDAKETYVYRAYPASS